MDYEKAYKEALERARELSIDGYLDAIAIDELFPELAQSEDEKIKEYLVSFIKMESGVNLSPDDAGKILAWLEKKGEQKSKDRYTFNSIPRLLEMINPTGKAKAYCRKLIESLLLEGYITDAKIVEGVLRGWNGEDIPMAVMDEQEPFDYEHANIQQKDFAPKIEPRFKVGNWYQCTKDFFGKGVTFDKNTAYYCAEEGCLQNEYGCHIAIVKDLYDNFKLWTIRDAKDGDVLFVENFDNIGGCIFLFKGLDSWKFDAEGDRAIATGYCCISITESGNTDFGIQGPDCVEIKRVHPATKEQRDTLFAKMEESGYKWNAERKELEKIEQKPAERKQENVEELSDFENAMMHIGGSFFGENAGLDPNDTAAIKEQAELLLELAPKQEWSEEDEDMRDTIIRDLKRLGGDIVNVKPAYKAEIDWLKSLRPHKQWKKEVGLKKDFELTWEDVAWIVNKTILQCRVESTLTAEDICKDVLRQFKAQKGE